MPSLYARLAEEFNAAYDKETGVLAPSFDKATVSRIVYPDATIDSNGMAHAPCDGYVCRVWIPIPHSDGEYYEDEREYSAGEFLPMNYELLEFAGERPFSKQFVAKQRRTKWAADNADLIEQIETKLSWSGFAMDVLSRAKRECGLTSRQAEAIDSMLKKADEKANESATEVVDNGHFGAVDGRFTATVTVEKVLEFDGFYGPYFIATFRTSCGKELTYKGGNPPISWPMADGGFIGGKGVTGELTFTIKAHTEYKGRSQTVIQRPRIKGMAINSN